MDAPLRVLFVCTGNFARSQMAKGFARHLGRGRIEAYSAGMAPSRLNSYAVRVMQEKDIATSGQRSKVFDWDLAKRIDVVVTVCGHANESCPVLPPEVKRLHWPLEDPAAAAETESDVLAGFRKIRDLVEAQIRDLLGEVEPPLWEILPESGNRA